jgi:3-polyprenyl-4-hydroxybenzoate decarboxylase
LSAGGAGPWGPVSNPGEQPGPGFQGISAGRREGEKANCSAVIAVGPAAVCAGRADGARESGGQRVFSTPHGLGYAKVVIVVDETVDPYNLPQVMWALSTKFNPQFDLVVLPGMSILSLDPGSDPEGMTYKMVIDATPPFRLKRTATTARSFAIQLVQNSG